MVVTITYLRLKSVWKYYSLIRYSSRIFVYAKKHSGNLAAKSRGMFKDHYTITSWSDSDSMKNFARSGYHLKAMRVAGDFSEIIRTYTYESDSLPSWKEARELIKEGKLIRY